MAEIENATKIEAIVDGYFSMWNELDASRRRAVTADTWTADARYVDPMFSAQGLEGLDAMVRGVHEQFPGHQFRLVGPIDAHHDRARWNWELVPVAGGAPVATGVDFAVLADDARLREVTGFFHQPA